MTPEDNTRDPASSPLELRASDRDREAALELLSVAAGDGRLTLEEYSGRAELALNARLQRELAELTADLERTVPDTSPVEPAEITAIRTAAASGMATRLLGTSSASVTCTRMKATMADMQRKCTSRMVWKLPNRFASAENCTGFQSAKPEITMRMPISMTPR